MEVDSLTASSDSQRNKEQRSSIEGNLNLGLTNFPPLSNSLGENGGEKENPRFVSKLDLNGVWSSFLLNENQNGKSNEVSTMSYQPTVMMGDKEGVSISSEILKEEVKACEELVIGYCVGRKLPFSMVKKATAELWKTKSEVSITLHSSNSFVFKFMNADDRNLALDKGAFYIGKSLFIVRPWSPWIENSIAQLKSIPVWIMIYNVPLHLWNNIGLSAIASFVGKPLLMDECTRNKTRLMYARVLVEISIDSEFPNSIPLWVDGKFVMNLPVEYQWKPQKCALCSSFGHSSNICSLNGAKSKTRRTPWKKQTSVNLEKSQSISKEMSIEKEIDGGGNIENVLIPPIDVQPNQQMVTNGVADFEKMAESGDVNGEPFIERKTYTRRNKDSSKSCVKPKETPICHLNPFGVLGASSETFHAETVEELPKSQEEQDKSVNTSCEVEKNHEDVVTCEDSSEESEHGTDGEELCVEKLKPLEEVSRRKTMSREQHIGSLMNISSLLGASIGDKEAEAKNVFGGIVDRYKSLKADKDLGPSSEKLGRGKRASAKKKL